MDNTLSILHIVPHINKTVISRVQVQGGDVFAQVNLG